MVPSVTTMLITSIDKISAVVTVRMLPNKKLIKFGEYPGVRNTNMIPMAMPSDQSMAIAESSLILAFWVLHSIPRAEIIAKKAAPINGFNPRK